MFDSNQFFGGERGFYPLNIEQSLRFNDDDSAYLSRTPASAGNRKTWTWSGWVKRGNLGGTQNLFTRDFISSSNGELLFNSSGILDFTDFNGSYTMRLTSSQVFRDVSAWYHIVAAVDTTQATASDRAKVYVNGVQITSFSTSTYPSLNLDTQINTALGHRIGSSLDGYLAEVHFVDGTAYDADAFGELKSGVWVAKSPSVTYGTNGFYLDFADSADIGNDVSGEGNDWTPNNFTASDVVLDSPTDNFCTVNPLDKTSGATLSNGNLDIAAPPNDWLAQTRATIAVSSGKWYWEVTQVAGGFAKCGVRSNDAALTSNTTSSTGSEFYFFNGNKQQGATDSAYGSALSGSNNVIGVALDMDNGKIWWAVNGTWQASGDPAAGTNAAFTNITGTQFPTTSSYNGSLSCNFGQLGFTYTPPTGYLALSTANLPEPTISPADDASPSDYFDIDTYTGTGTTHERSALQFQPDFVWIKGRNNTTNHVLSDIVRGATEVLESDSTAAEYTDATSITSFDSDGFTLGASNDVNNSTSGFNSYVAWAWKANGSGVSNTDGTITSTVSANTTSGFSIVSYTANGATSDETIGHGLGVTPNFAIIKSRNATGNWLVEFNVLDGSGDYMYLNTTGVKADLYSTIGDSSVLNTPFGNNGNTYIAYCFHSVEGFSKFGSYTGNGSADGVFVYLGFRPAFVMTKVTTTTGSWTIIDNGRDTYNVTEGRLYPNLSNAEETGAAIHDFLSNGFKLRNGTGSLINQSGATYIYAAFAENPFKYSNAR